KAGDQLSFQTLHSKLVMQAHDLDLPLSHITDAVMAAWERLQLPLLRFASPAEISPELLAGDKVLLSAIDMSRDLYYTISVSDFKFYGDFRQYACQFVRRSETTLPLLDQFFSGDPSVPFASDNVSDDLHADDQAALDVLGMLVEAAQGE